MSKINNSYEYYQSNQGLLSMLNKNKGGNALINQIVSNNDLKYQQKMEAMGVGNGSGQSKYKNVDKAATNLLDALEKLGDEDLYKAENGEELDKSTIIKKVSNFVTAYNSTITNLGSCGGSLNTSFKTEFEATFKEKAESFEKLGITMNKDNKLAIDGEKLNAASIDDIKELFGKESSYVSNLAASASSINTIIGKALAMSSSNYNAKGLSLF